MTSICGHSFIEERLPIAASVLDVGSRNYDFAEGILKLRRQARVTCIEPDHGVPDPEDARIDRITAALVGDSRVRDEYWAYSTGEGNCLSKDTRLTKYPDWNAYQVDCIRLQDIEREHWDLIKLDCEGSEFSILENWPASVTVDQITVEFHDYMDPQKWDAQYFDELFEKLSQFKVVKHPLFKQGESLGHWDTLMVKR